MTTAVISHQECEFHENGQPHHPECSERLSAINNRLISSGVDWILRNYDAPLVTREQLLLVHDEEYIERVIAAVPNKGETIVLDGDTGMNHHSLDAAYASAGAAVMAVDFVMQEKHNHIFCKIRPPGHHAKKNKAAGFCIFNNVAVGAAYAMKQFGLQRIAIVDFDVHHGDGTEEVFINDPRVLFCSSFQHPFYPFSGADTHSDNILNIPLPAGTGSREWRAAVEKKWLPALDNFKPELIIISAGFDSHLEDDMGGFNLVEADYQWITHELCKLAKTHAQGRVISCLEGGYELSSLGRSVMVHIKELAEFI
ncbi:MAG: histone deacetylase family protein [Gammaproteobacteria bacterium]|nr:histone deacetylase family protein [Gammaproteobacteria bacterium]